MSNTDIIRSLQSAMEAKQTPTPYDAPAVVTRIEGNATAWVKIAGSDTETPVKLTIDAKAGDTVQVRVGGGSAWLTGNQTAPPTDDTKAEKAMEQANKASGVATNYVTDTKDGIFVHPKNNDADGVRITDAIEILKGGLSFFRAWVENGLAKVRVGKADAGHTNIDSNGMRVFGGDGSELLANIGYGEGNSGDAVATAPYYDFGVRDTTRDIGNYSATFGYANSAENAYSMAAGAGNKSIGSYAYAFGTWLIAHSNQFVTGIFNKADPNKIFIIGNGELSDDDNDRANIFEVDFDGVVWAAGGYSGLVATEDVTVSITYAAGTIGSRGATESLGTTVKAGHVYIGAVITDNRSTSAFNATIQGNGPNNTAHLAVYRATGNAVSNASVTVRKIWLKTGGA